MEGFWLDCLSRFRKELSSQQFNTWIKPLKFEVTADEKFRLIAPNRFVLQWVKEKFLSRIETMAEERLSSPASILLALPESGEESVAPAVVTASRTATPIQAEAKDTSGLNPAFTFANYVPGKANQSGRCPPFFIFRP